MAEDPKVAVLTTVQSLLLHAQKLHTFEKRHHPDPSQIPSRTSSLASLGGSQSRTGGVRFPAPATENLAAVLKIFPRPTDSKPIAVGKAPVPPKES